MFKVIGTGVRLAEKRALDSKGKVWRRTLKLQGLGVTAECAAASGEAGDKLWSSMILGESYEVEGELTQGFSGKMDVVITSARPMSAAGRKVA